MTQNHDPYSEAKELKGLTLGQPAQYEAIYNPDVLQAVPRKLNRDAIELTTELPFHGVDVWTGYELSWLNAKGKPMVAIVEFYVDYQSENLIESKSFKLYLNTFNLTRFDSIDDVEKAMIRDLSECAQGKVEVKIIEPKQFGNQRIASLPGTCIDEIDIEVDDYQFNAKYLENCTDEGQIVAETLNSNLLKSNCLITTQPDWGSLMIRYQGPKIDREKLLRYLISFREHNEFHEQCVERIFMDLKRFCNCSKLTVFARYTRRGGLDINPYRSDFEQLNDNVRLARQ
ncbi:NADPH-dependent 7-cyano-7-deazaguanine reductase QueF [Parashewanella curva]|uniref:NADPH-dependent 7-cyano-7-deazaguanine reductase n=1 Tax=Parashewanella curva TaxID=2338552 RepID=A0A3L8PSS0_9GAMM|nr:NADPH-dependent 7-cyano-7-deazaguanine reductase QueF [Parashewanella curva]RLV57869.1 NADPH-dependent 7-cyano-7-deazaguanine reductase QueF [Parashewanella curva]